MDIADRQRWLIETLAARERAEATVQELIRARAECQRQLDQTSRKDVYKSVTGKSALDKAVAEAQRVVAALDRAIEEVRKQLAACPGAVLAEGVAPVMRSKPAAAGRE